MILRIPIGAFLLNPDSISAVEAMKEDRFFFRSTIEVHEGGIDAASVYLGDKKTPTLLIVETVAKKDKMFEQLEALANVCDPETRLIVIGEENDIVLFRTLIAEGVSDYLIHPVTEEGLKATNKYFNVTGDQLLDKLEKIRTQGFRYIMGAFIFGIETDTRDSLDYTIRFARDCGISLAQFVPMTPLPGTVDFHMLRKGKKKTSRTSSKSSKKVSTSSLMTRTSTPTTS